MTLLLKRLSAAANVLDEFNLPITAAAVRDAILIVRAHQPTDWNVYEEAARVGWDGTGDPGRWLVARVEQLSRIHTPN